MLRMNDDDFKGSDTGSDFWRDLTVQYGIDEAIIIGNNYLGLNLRREHSEDEEVFCRELFAAMYEAISAKVDAKRIVYPYTLEEAKGRMEVSCFYSSAEFNESCAKAIDEAITDSCYESNRHNLDLAAMKVLCEYGFERVNAVLAHYIHEHRNDDRYSQANKDWAADFATPSEAFSEAYLKSHATLLDHFTAYLIRLYNEFDASGFALPGQWEYGEFVKGYEIKHAIMIDDRRGYAVAYNPHAVEHFVCWQFYIRDGERSYNWGVYGNEKAAIDAYNARVFVAFN